MLADGLDLESMLALEVSVGMMQGSDARSWAIPRMTANRVRARRWTAKVLPVGFILTVLGGWAFLGAVGGAVLWFRL